MSLDLDLDFKIDMCPTEVIERKFYNFDEKAEEAAAKVGCKVVLPKPNQLLVDIDSEDSFHYFMRRIAEFIERTDNNVSYIVKSSKSGFPHRHIYITVEDYVFNDWERIALQTMLGSDPVREGLNALRLWTRIPDPTRFFEPLNT